MSLLSNTVVLLSKELRTEFRSRELLTTTVVFILVVLILFSFAISPTSEESRDFGPGLLWLAILFAASLMLQPCFLREQSNDTLSSLRLAVSDPVLDFLAKLIANTLFLLVTETLDASALRGVSITFRFCRSFTTCCWFSCWAVWAFPIAGTALSAISAQARMRELAAPAFAAAVADAGSDCQRRASLVSLLGPAPVVRWKGMAFLVAFDVVFLTALWLFGEYLLEE